MIDLKNLSRIQYSERKRKQKKDRKNRDQKSNTIQIVGVLGIEEKEWGRGNIWREKEWDISWPDGKYQL